MTVEVPEFTVLIALWQGDQPSQVERALSSATHEQLLRPACLVLTVDGPLTPALESVVERAEKGEWGPARIARTPSHGGLANALERGLALCPTDVVARADADDINVPERFQRQIPEFADGSLDLLGSAMRELGTGALRSRPLSERDIRAYCRDHNPFQHPTVVFRASAVRAAGGYRHLPFMEDWFLWYRMLKSGARARNLPDPLVDYRVNSALYRRRGGISPLRSDVILQRTMLRDGYTTVLRSARNLAVRLAYRSLGPRIRTLMYSLIIERRRPAAGCDTAREPRATRFPPTPSR